MTEPYLDETEPVDRRVEDLLERMTIEEKVGQMVGMTIYQGGQDAVFLHGDIRSLGRPGLGVADVLGRGRLGHGPPTRGRAVMFLCLIPAFAVLTCLVQRGLDALHNSNLSGRIGGPGAGPAL